jgi:hypothetical protein
MFLAFLFCHDDWRQALDTTPYLLDSKGWYTALGVLLGEPHPQLGRSVR